VYKTVTVELALTCVHCAADIPIGTLADEVACTQCATTNVFPWRGMFEIDVNGVSVSLAEALPGLREGASFRGSSRATRLGLSVGALQCACGTAFTDVQLHSINRLHAAITCACGVTTPARKPPESLVKAYPNVILIVGETSSISQAPRLGLVFRT
jgi:hypothetical protein